MRVKDIQGAFSKGFGGVGPVGGRNLAHGITQDGAGGHTHLQPKRVLAVRRTRGVNHGRLAHHKDRLVRQQARLGLLVGPGHLVKAWSDMDIGEGFQCLGLPVRQVGQRQMDHHRPGRMGKPGHRIVKRRGRATGQTRQSLRGNPRNHRLGRRDRAAIGQFDPRRPGAVMQDAGDRGTGFNHAAPRLNRRDKRFHDGIRAALTYHHPERLPGHALQIGKHRPARDIGGKIQMHSPGTQHRLNMRMREGFGQPGARGGQQEANQVKRATQTLGAQRFKHEICKRTEFHGAAEKAEEVRRLCSETREQGIPLCGIFGRQGCDGGRGFRQIRRYSNPASVGKG